MADQAGHLVLTRLGRLPHDVGTALSLLCPVGGATGPQGTWRSLKQRSPTGHCFASKLGIKVNRTPSKIKLLFEMLIVFLADQLVECSDDVTKVRKEEERGRGNKKKKRKPSYSKCR